jgi:hypothetical protein
VTLAVAMRAAHPPAEQLTMLRAAPATLQAVQLPMPALLDHAAMGGHHGVRPRLVAPAAANTAAAQAKMSSYHHLMPVPRRGGVVATKLCQCPRQAPAAANAVCHGHVASSSPQIVDACGKLQRSYICCIRGGIESASAARAPAAGCAHLAVAALGCPTARCGATAWGMECIPFIMNLQGEREENKRPARRAAMHPSCVVSPHTRTKLGRSGACEGRAVLCRAPITKEVVRR